MTDSRLGWWWWWCIEELREKLKASGRTNLRKQSSVLYLMAHGSHHPAISTHNVATTVSTEKVSKREGWSTRLKIVVRIWYWSDGWSVRPREGPHVLTVLFSHSHIAITCAGWCVNRPKEASAEAPPKDALQAVVIKEQPKTGHGSASPLLYFRSFCFELPVEVRSRSLFASWWLQCCERPSV